MSDATLFVPRRTGPLSDVLEALGAACLARQTAGVAWEAVRLVQTGGGFEIRVCGATRPTRGIEPLIPYFKSDPNDDKRPKRGEVYDYAADKRRSDERHAATAARGRTATRRRRAVREVTEEQEDRGQSSPRWPVFNTLQSLTKGAFATDWNETWERLDALDDTDAMAAANQAWALLQTRLSPLRSDVQQAKPGVA